MITAENVREADMWDLGEFRPTTRNFILMQKQFYEYIRQYVDIRKFKNSSLSYDGYFPIRHYTKDKFVRSVEVRGPRSNRIIHTEQDIGVCKWHSDVWDKRENLFILVWANHMPTEFKRRYGNITYTVPTRHVILFDNGKWLHRFPPMEAKDVAKRFFIRSYLFDD